MSGIDVLNQLREALAAETVANEELTHLVSKAYDEVRKILVRPERSLQALAEIRACLKAERTRRALLEDQVEAWGLGVRKAGRELVIPARLWESCRARAEWRQAALEMGLTRIATNDDLREAVVRLRACKTAIAELLRRDEKILDSLDQLPQLDEDPTREERARRHLWRTKRWQEEVERWKCERAVAIAIGQPIPPEPAPPPRREERTLSSVREIVAKAMRAVEGGKLKSPYLLELLKVYESSPYLEAGRARQRQRGPTLTATTNTAKVTAGRVVWDTTNNTFVVSGSEALDADTVQHLMDAAGCCPDGQPLQGTWGEQRVVAYPDKIRVGDEEMVIE